MKLEKIVSEYDGLGLETAVAAPKGPPKGIVQFSHGMAEHKERYYDFMNYLINRGYICVIHDHRGHGESVKMKEDLGYFYTENEQVMIEDLYTITKTIQMRYQDIPVYLFSHSMGTLVARGYIKRYGSEIEKLVLCGPPTHNPATGGALILAKFVNLFYKEKRSNQLLNRLVFKNFNKGKEVQNGWISVNPNNVADYNKDPKCGFVFTTNGFINLFKLQKGAFNKSGWQVANPDMPIFVITGEEDPVIRSKEHFEELIQFLGARGYTDIKSKLYSRMSHEILNETERMEVYKDIGDFFDS